MTVVHEPQTIVRYSVYPFERCIQRCAILEFETIRICVCEAMCIRIAIVRQVYQIENFDLIWLAIEKSMP